MAKILPPQALTVARLTRQFEVADTSSLATTDSTGLGTLIVQHAERGGILTRDALQTGVANKVTRFNVGGVFFVRSTPPREWRVDHMDIAGDFGGDIAAALNWLTQFQVDGDNLIFGVKKYKAITSWIQGVPVQFFGEGAIIDVNHDVIACDLYPSGTRADGTTRYIAGDVYGGAISYGGLLPRIQRTIRKNGDTNPEAPWTLVPGNVGVRLNNTYHAELSVGQGITGFSDGLWLYADRKELGIRDAGVSYNKVSLGRLENYTNVKETFAPNGVTGTTPNNYVTQNQFHGGSFNVGTNWDASVNFANGVHIMIDGGAKNDMSDSQTFYSPVFEGAHGTGFQVIGHASKHKIIAGRMEMPFVTRAVDFGVDTYACTAEFGGMPNNSGTLDPLATVRDLGRFNEVTGRDYPRGQCRLYGGRWTFDGKIYGQDAGLRDWEPADLRKEPILQFNYVCQSVTTVVVDPRKFRRLLILVVPDTVAGTTPAAAGPVYNNIYSFDLTRAPTFDGWEYEVELRQGAYITTIGAAWLPTEIKFCEFQQPVVRINGRDVYTVRFQDGQYYIISHKKT
jgi:hypothetical protein